MSKVAAASSIFQALATTDLAPATKKAAGKPVISSDACKRETPVSHADSTANRQRGKASRLMHSPTVKRRKQLGSRFVSSVSFLSLRAHRALDSGVRPSSAK